MSNETSLNIPPKAFANGYMGYHYTKVSVASGDKRVLYTAPQGAWHNISIILSIPSDTAVEVSNSPSAVIEDDIANSHTNANWATVTAAAFMVITAQVQAIRFTASGSDIVAEVID